VERVALAEEDAVVVRSHRLVSLASRSGIATIILALALAPVSQAATQRTLNQDASAAATEAPATQTAASEAPATQAASEAPLCSGVQGTTTVHFHYDWIPTSGDVPILAAQHFGWFTECGLDVQVTPGGPEVNCAILVAAGQQDICISPAVGIVGAYPTGVPYHSVGLIQQKAPYGLIMNPTENVKTPQDLLGKKLGTQTDNTYYALWKAFEKAQNLDPSQITEVQVGFGPEPIFTGTVDGIMDFLSLDPALVKQHYGQDATTFLFADYGAWAGGQALIANDAFAAAHPDAVKAFVAAYGKGLRWALENQADAIDLVTTSYPDLPKDIVSQELPALMEFSHSADTDAHGLLYQPPDVWQRTYQMLKDYGIVTEDFDVSKVYTDAYWTPGM
jgi:ABC-type nitrate/sulfonate/bicarbonate transport system substrate-binding protein